MNDEASLTINPYAAWEQLRLMFIEMNKYNVPCPYKRALENNAVQALRDCEDEFDPFARDGKISATPDDVGLRSREYFLSTMDSWCHPTEATEQEKPTLIDDFYEAMHINTAKEKALDAEDVTAWETCQYPHRSELSTEYLEKINEEVPEKNALTRTKSAHQRVASPQKTATLSHDKPEKAPKTSLWMMQKLASAPISKIGRSPESESCVREMLKDKRTEEKTSTGSGPPTSGSYFVKAAAEAVPEKSTVKKPKSGKLDYQVRTYAADRKPKSHKFRRSLVTDEDGIFTHDMSGTYYMDMYRSAKFEERAASTRMMQSVIRTKLSRSQRTKPAYLQSAVPNNPGFSNVVVQLCERDMATMSNRHYRRSEESAEVQVDTGSKSYLYRGRGGRKQEDTVVGPWLEKPNRNMNYVFSSASSAGTKLPQGIHRANLPQHDRKGKRKNSGHRSSVRGVPSSSRPFSSFEQHMDTIPFVVSTEREGSPHTMVNRSRPSIPSNARGVVCPSALVTTAYFVKKPMQGKVALTKKQMMKAESFNDFMERKR